MSKTLKVAMKLHIHSMIRIQYVLIYAGKTSNEHRVFATVVIHIENFNFPITSTTISQVFSGYMYCKFLTFVNCVNYYDLFYDS